MTDQLTINKDDIIEALRDVYDPEIPVNIVDLGLVYDVNVNKSNVDVQIKPLQTCKCCSYRFIALTGAAVYGFVTRQVMKM